MNSARFVPPTGQTGRVTPQNSSGNSCLAWYLVTYYDDGSYDYDYLGTTCDDCEMTRHINNSKENFVTNCGGGGGGGGDGTTTVINYDTVHNDLTTPCTSNTFNTMLSSGLNSELATIVRNTFGSSDDLDYVINEGANISDPNADAHTYGQKAGTYTRVTTTLSQAQLGNASKEYLAETIFHEILHGFLTANTDIHDEMQQHCEMINTYVDCELAALQEMFPSLTNHDGLCLILGGMAQVQLYDTATFNTVLSHYSLTDNDVAQTNTSFKTGNSGHRCNPSEPLN